MLCIRLIEHTALLAAHALWLLIWLLVRLLVGLTVLLIWILTIVVWRHLLCFVLHNKTDDKADNAEEQTAAKPRSRHIIAFFLHDAHTHKAENKCKDKSKYNK